MIDSHPEFLDGSLPSLGARLDIAEEAVAKLGAAVAEKKIAEWGRPATDI